LGAHSVHVTGRIPEAQEGKMTTVPAYLELLRSGELARRARQAWHSLASCRLCPRQCSVDRFAGQTGFCRMGAEPVLASWNIHYGEEPPISGTNGSGTIFFTGCTGRCLFCQNYPISQLAVGQQITIHRLAGVMLELQKRGCHNINLVTPTHFVAAILRAVYEAAQRGLSIPLVYNTSGYESTETLRLLDGVVDIYLPDAKYASDEVALALSGFPNYVAVNRAALLEMARQVGPHLTLSPEGLAVRGMIIRHMVLPDGLSQTPEVLRWVAKNVSHSVPVSIMSQYFPAHRAFGHPSLGRKITPAEYEAALAAFNAAGLTCGWLQEPFADTDHEPVSGWERASDSAA